MNETCTNQGRDAAGAFDVVICGGGLAGPLLARHIRRELPEIAVTVLERTTRPLPDACHKVGESSVDRHKLPDIARDVERGLGPVRRHPQAAQALELLMQGAPR